jgi:hypothetical protein
MIDTNNWKNYTNIIYLEHNNGFIHNLNGPAIIWADGALSYYIDGECIGNNLSNKEFEQKIKELVFK